MIRVMVAALGLAFAADVSAQTPATEEQREVGRAGDTLQYVIPVAALAMTFLLDREDGRPGFLGLNLDGDDFLHLNDSPRHDLALALGRSFFITQGLKFAVNEKRPNGGSHSFPSGHTSFAFTGAEFIRKEYGWKWGIPAYLLAGYVGYSRVESNAHYTHDVLAGALIGILSNHDFGEMKTRYGSLTFSPGLMSSDHSPLLDLPAQSAPTLGVSFKLRF